MKLLTINTKTLPFLFILNKKGDTILIQNLFRLFKHPGIDKTTLEIIIYYLGLSDSSKNISSPLIWIGRYIFTGTKILNTLLTERINNTVIYILFSQIWFLKLINYWQIWILSIIFFNSNNKIISLLNFYYLSLNKYTNKTNRLNQHKNGFHSNMPKNNRKKPENDEIDFNEYLKTSQDTCLKKLKKIEEKRLTRDKYKFENLYQFIYDLELLHHSYSSLKKSRPEFGEIPNWEERLELLSQNLKDGTYKPKPEKRFLINKRKNFKPFTAQLPRFEDAIVQHIFYLILFRIWSPKFKNLAFRKGVHISIPDRISHFKKALQFVNHRRWHLNQRSNIDKVDYNKLASKLKKFINDRHIIYLFWKLSIAGYFIHLHTTDGTSPNITFLNACLINIYFIDFDIKIGTLKKHKWLIYVRVGFWISLGVFGRTPSNLKKKAWVEKKISEFENSEFEKKNS